MRQSICVNPNCKSVFTPGKRHPNQQYCSRVECRRYAGSLRGRRYYARHCSDQAWYRRMLDRKREERLRRGCSARPDGGRRGGAAYTAASPDTAVSPNAAASPNTAVILQLLAGMAAMFTGSHDTSEVRGTVNQCLDFGRELFDAGDTQESFFSKLFLTSVHAGSDTDPNAGIFSNPFRC